MADSDDDRQSAAALISSNCDILTEILIRLPAASIVRFKSVCKQWRLLLSHSFHIFPHRYDNLLKSPGIFIDNALYVPFDNDNVEHRSTPPFRSLDFYFDRFDVKIEQSCNGLLLCSTGDRNYYYVFNPTTKQLAIIPSVPEHSYSLALAFHQTHCVHYKVVCIIEVDYERDLYQIQVYSSDTRTWRICVEAFGIESDYECLPFFRNPIYWNGAVLWVPDYEDDFLHFKLDDEELEILPGPEGLWSDISLLYFGESRGHLHSVCEEHRLRVNVYEMLRDRSGWFVKYQLQLDSLLGDFLEMVRYGECDFEVVDAVIGKGEEDTFLVLLIHTKMLRYNVHDKSFKELHYECFKVPWYYHRYIETLSSF